MTLQALLLIACLLRGINAEQSAWSEGIFNLTKFQSLLNSRDLCRSVVYRLVTTTTMDLAARELDRGDDSRKRAQREMDLSKGR